MRKFIAIIAITLASLSAFAQQEWNALNADQGFTLNNDGSMSRTFLIPGLATSWTNDRAMPFAIASIEARRADGGASTNVLTMKRTRTVAYGGVTSTWTDIILLQGWTNVGNSAMEPAFTRIVSTDILSITNTVTNVSVTVNAGKR